MQTVWLLLFGKLLQHRIIIQTEPFLITSLYNTYRIHSLVAACTKLCLSAQSAYLWMGTSNHNQNNYKHSTLKLLLIKHHYLLFCHGKLITSCFAMGSSLLPVLPWEAHYFLFFCRKLITSCFPNASIKL